MPLGANKAALFAASAGGFSTSGGTMAIDGDYQVHTFTSSGNFVVSGSGDGITVDFLVIAGGGSGGDNLAGGGGAGGYRNSYSTEATGGGGTNQSALAITDNTYAVVVGAGGAAITWDGVVSSREGNDGNTSSVSSISTVGGGG